VQEGNGWPADDVFLGEGSFIGPDEKNCGFQVITLEEEAVQVSGSEAIGE
jgi:hypothetical protein